MSRKNKKSKPEEKSPETPEPARESVSRSRKKADIFILALLLVATVIRMINLGKAELWQDELGFLIYAQTKLSLGEVMRTSWDLILSIGQMPLSFIVFNICYRIMEVVTETIGPFTPALARFPSVVFGVAAVWTSYKLAARVLDATAARIVAVIMTVFFFPVYYSREAYVYAQILMLTPLALYAAVEIMFGKVKSPGIFALLFFSLSAILYSHLGALMVVVALAGCILVFWIISLKQKDPSVSRPLFNAGLVTAAALLFASPYILRFVLFNKAHTSGSEYSHLVIINDVIAKLFLGERFWPNVISWVVFAAGSVSLLMLPGDRARERRLTGWVTIIGLLAITWATQRSQYLSARYFSPVAPLVLLVMGQGLHQIGLWAARLLRLPEAKRAYVCLAVAALPIAVHAFVYLPAMLNLSQKSTPFGAVARWINENLEPGVPYLMESAYEIRWVGQSFPTPNNPPAAPYVHGNELVTLHQKQIEFINRFPEAPFIESAHHNWDAPEGLWDWPHKNFANHVIIGDPESTRKLIRMGIYPGFPREKLSQYSYRIDVYYNSLSNRLEKARQSNPPVLIGYKDWMFQGQQISPQETLYFRVGPGHQGNIQVVNLGPEPLAGILQIRAALPGPPNQSAHLQIRKDNEILHRVRLPTNKAGDLDVPVPELQPGENLVNWQRGINENMGEGFILLDAAWK